MFAASKSGITTGGGPAPTTDPSFAYVPLLLNTTSTNGQQNNTFLDSGTANGGVGFTITRSGTPTQGSITPYWPNGQWGNYFPGGASDTLSLATNAIPASGAFTFETFVYVTGTAASQVIAAQYPNGTASGRFQILWNDTANKFTVILGSGSVFVSDATYSANTWLYLVVQRDASNVWSMYVNGTRNSATVTNATAIDTAVTYIGNRNTGGTPYTGYISNLRVVTSALYSGSTISVPTTPFSVSTTNQVLLTCYSNRFIDANTATTAKVITVTGTPRVQAFQPFSPAASYTTAAYGGSGYFNGSTDNLSAASNAAFGFGTGDFTIDLWAYVANTSNAMSLVDLRNGVESTVNPLLYMAIGGAISWLVNGAVQIASSAITANSWVHIAVSRSSASTKLFINGKQAGSTYSDSNNYGQSSAFIGRGSVAATLYVNGYLSNVRLVKGTGVYTGDFTPPTLAPLTTAGSTSAASYPSTTNVNTSFAAANTSLLLNFTNAGIYDAAVQNVITTVGDAQVSNTITAQFPPTSMKFDGTGDYLTLPVNSADTFGSGNWTIEGWFYFSSVSGFPEIFSKETPSNNGIRCVLVSSRVNLSLSSNGTTYATTVAGGTNLTTGTWYYLAFTRSSNAITIYLNGTSDGTGTFTGSLYETNTFWSLASRGGAGTLFNGYIQDFRITKGVARTIAPPPPSAPFPTR